MGCAVAFVCFVCLCLCVCCVFFVCFFWGGGVGDFFFVFLPFPSSLFNGFTCNIDLIKSPLCFIIIVCE